MENAKSILKHVNRELGEVTNKIDRILQADTLEIKKAMECLNEAIRMLDHAVEHLETTK